MTLKDTNSTAEAVAYPFFPDTRPKSVGYLVGSIAQWGVNRNITAEGGATALSQTKKMFEEVQEFVDAKTHEEAKDAVGDMFVVLVQMCRLRGYDMAECLEGAWNEIKHRKGTMVDGVFVKEE